MRIFIYLFTLVVFSSFFASCETDVEAIDLQVPYTYSDLYYQNLRDFKASDHPVSFGWFAQYGQQNSLGVRFMGLPDSLDICSLWGGIPPKENKDIWEELRFVQKVKGTKMLVVAITRIDAELDEHEFKQKYLEARQMPAGEEKEAALLSSIEMYADYFLDQVFENDLDGFDADYEPEGDFLTGQYFVHFMNHLSKYMGPNPNITQEERLRLIQERYGKDVTDTNKLLCVDAPGDPMHDLIDICDYYIKQAYSGGINTGWPVEKVIFCTNMGDNWKGTMSQMYEHARYKPSNGKKGGFGAFFIHRDHNVHENNPFPYKRFRECIQIQNPAVI